MGLPGPRPGGVEATQGHIFTVILPATFIRQSPQTGMMQTLPPWALLAQLAWQHANRVLPPEPTQNRESTGWAKPPGAHT